MGGPGMRNFRPRGSSCPWTRWFASVLLQATVVAVLALVAAPAHGQTVSATVSVGKTPDAVAINPVTNRIYIANQGSNNVTVIDGASNTAITVSVGSRPIAVAVNPATNKVYVANQNSNNVTVIDAANNNATTTVNAGSSPSAVAVNPLTNKIYVADSESNNVTVIDGGTNTTSTVSAGSGPFAVA